MQLKELARHQQAEIASLRRVIEAKDTEISDWIQRLGDCRRELDGSTE